jgi:hypothetical protein
VVLDVVDVELVVVVDVVVEVVVVETHNTASPEA